MKVPFKEKLRQDVPLVGIIQTLASSEITEIIAAAGFDWLFVDLEHGTLGIREAQVLLQAANPALDCLVRVPANQEDWIKKSLDIGADGIIIPQIHSAREAARAVASCKYPPQGNRSVGIARAHGYGPHFDQYVANANDEIAVVLQIEHSQAVANIDAIAGVPGIDALFVGPYDLSASMGKPGRVNDADVQRAIAAVKECADAVGLPVGIFAADPVAARACMAAGYKLIAVGMDTLLLGKAARETVAALR